MIIFNRNNFVSLFSVLLLLTTTTINAFSGFIDINHYSSKISLNKKTSLLQVSSSETSLSIFNFISENETEEDELDHNFHSLVLAFVIIWLVFGYSTVFFKKRYFNYFHKHPIYLIICVLRN
ncbi:MAG: hypothetical protein KatS3mg027_2524 [Bacteroidia bacterium]|nr:MAG: hypothetical protein KatS3mg027_2524 [Bacteroidia bacterium]